MPLVLVVIHVVRVAPAIIVDEYASMCCRRQKDEEMNEAIRRYLLNL